MYGLIIISVPFGLCFDIFSRKKPVLLILAIGILGQFAMPFIKTVGGYCFVNILTIPLPFIAMSNPWVPDLIMEESQGWANMLRANVL
jgi:hypothetical protein